MIRLRHVLLPAAAVLAVPVSSLLLAGDLPSPVARHFTVDGTADASAPLLALTALITAVVLLVVAGSLAAARTAPDRSTARTLVAVAHAMGVGLASLHLAVLLAQRGLGDWTEASVSLASTLAALLLPGAVAGGVGWLGSRDVEVEEEDRTVPPEQVELSPGEAVVWVGRTSAAWAPLLSAVMTAILVAAYLATGDVVAVALLLPAALVAGLVGRARVSVGPAGVRVVGGVVPVWPRVEVPLDEVTEVRVERVRALTYGGLGYRVKPGVRAVVTWPGEALSVGRADGARVVVTVPGARTAAGVLLAHLDTTTQDA